MDTALKAEIQEIVELVKTVPEPLQVRTLELLLQDLLGRTSGQERPTTNKPKENRGDDAGEVKVKNSRRESAGLSLDTLPMRVKAFMKRTQVTDKQIERLFHIEGDQFEPIWALKTTKFSETQVEVALLQSLQRALTSGEFSFDRETVRQECMKRNSYNKNNFLANFRNSKRYFSGLEKEGLVSLSDEGMTALAALVNELAGVKDGN